ncbi:MAG: hypothetical protein Q8L98_07915 [Chlamydiales bacterium]|nr:hypothetical protein [Chlamydiales bacterium]
MCTQPVGLSTFSNQRQEESYRFSGLLPGIARNISKFAIPIIAIAAMSNIPGADAGPLAYSACVIGCIPVISGLAGPASAACMMWCAALIPLPGP